MRGPLIRLVLRRVLAGVAVLLIVSVVLFSATHVLPGDLATRILGNRATPEAVAELREKMGLNRSYPEQYFGWLTGFLTGDAGYSTTGQEVWPILRERGTNSLILAAAASLLVVVIAMALGVVSR